MEVKVGDVPIGGMFGWGKRGATYIRIAAIHTSFLKSEKEGKVVVALVVNAAEHSTPSMHITTFSSDATVKLLP